MPRPASCIAALTLTALAGCVHYAPAPESAAGSGPATGAPATPGSALDPQARGRELAKLFWAADGSAWHAQISPQVKGRVTVEQIQAANAGLKAKLGGEKVVLSEQVIDFQGAPAYQRSFVSEASPDPLDFNLVLDPQGLILIYTIRPHGAPIVPGP
jgi:hypothetical protein